MAKAKQEQSQGTEQKAPRTKKIGRAAAANRVVAEMGERATLSELAAEADALCVASGMKSRLPAAVYFIRRALETLEACGAVKLTRPSDIIVERAKGK